jgi:hypothetical protein
MASEEMVLIPRIRYDRLIASSEQEQHDKTIGNGSDKKETDSLLSRDNDEKVEVSESKGVKESPPPKGGKSTRQTVDKAEKKIVAKMSMDTILNELSPEYRDSAEKILRRINDEGGVELNWNLRGRFIHKGVVVNGSNMSELLQRFFSKEKVKKPAGFKLFLSGLTQLNIEKPKSKKEKRKNSKSVDEKKMLSLKKAWLSY